MHESNWNDPFHVHVVNIDRRITWKHTCRCIAEIINDYIQTEIWDKVRCTFNICNVIEEGRDRL